MKDIEAMYQEALDVAMKLPPEQAHELIVAASMVYSAVQASQIAYQAMIEASAKPVWVAM